MYPRLGSYVATPYNTMGLCDIGHQGLPWDREFQKYNNRTRIYDPVFGRFLQRDPLMYVDGMSMYQYVGSRPLRWLDPFGLNGWDRFCLGLRGVGCVIGGIVQISGGCVIAGGSVIDPIPGDEAVGVPLGGYLVVNGYVTGSFGVGMIAAAIFGEDNTVEIADDLPTGLSSSIDWSLTQGNPTGIGQILDSAVGLTTNPLNSPLDLALAGSDLHSLAEGLDRLDDTLNNKPGSQTLEERIEQMMSPGLAFQQDPLQQLLIQLTKPKH